MKAKEFAAERAKMAESEILRMEVRVCVCVCVSVCVCVCAFVFVFVPGRLL